MRKHRALLWIATGFFAASALVFADWIPDDAHVSFRYAQSAAAGVDPVGLAVCMSFLAALALLWMTVSLVAERVAAIAGDTPASQSIVAADTWRGFQ